MYRFLKITVKIIIAYFLLSSLGMFGAHQFFIGNADRGEKYLQTFGVIFMGLLFCIFCAAPFLLASTELSEIVFKIVGLLISPFLFTSSLSFISLIIADFFTLAFQVIEIEP